MGDEQRFWCNGANKNALGTEAESDSETLADFLLQLHDINLAFLPALLQQSSHLLINLLLPLLGGEIVHVAKLGRLEGTQGIGGRQLGFGGPLLEGHGAARRSSRRWLTRA